MLQNKTNFSSNPTCSEVRFDQEGRASATEEISRIAVYDSDEPSSDELACKDERRTKSVLDNWQSLMGAKPNEGELKVTEVVRRQSKVAAGEKDF